MDDVVQKFLSDCRFGQTEIGSYVVSVVCPFAELNEGEGYKQLSIFSDEEQCAESLTRKITNKVMKNITIVYLDENDKPKTVSVQLDKNDYDKAIVAHADGKHVEVTGELSTTKRPSMTCELFSIID